MTRKTAFFEGWSWFKFNNLGLALGANLKFYTSVPKGLKLNSRKFWELTPTFLEVTGEKLLREHFAPPRSPPPTLSWIGLNEVQYLHFLVFFILLCALSWSWEVQLSDKWLRLIEKANFSHQKFVFIFQWLE